MMEMGPLLFQIAQGIGLAACAGLRAFLPLFVVGVAGRLEWIPLTSSFEWLASWPALVVFGVAVLVEILGDKFPLVDNFLDAAQTFVKPIAGTVLVASTLTELSALQAAVLAIILGGSVASIVHLGKAKLRLLSTVTTAGVGNPVISTVEDGSSLVGSIFAILWPFFLLLLIVLAMVALWVGFRVFRPRPA